MKSADFMISVGKCPICGDSCISNNYKDFKESNKDHLLNTYLKNRDWYNYGWSGVALNPCMATLDDMTIYNTVDTYSYDSLIVKWLMGDSSDESTSGVAFTLNFKATGIQATGFKDYKEAFAAPNSRAA